MLRNIWLKLGPLLSLSLLQSGEKDPFEKRFTRCEMDKVIREKNMYKEKYLELQEDLRYFITTVSLPKFWLV